MEKILFATDLSVRSDRALDRALLLAADRRAILHILHVVEKDPHLPNTYVQRDIAKAIERLESEMEDLFGSGWVTPIHQVVEGEPVAKIVDIADQLDADLIVMGLSRDFSTETLFLGTTADKVIAKSRRPVLIVKARPKRGYEKILVALDQSLPSRSSLETALKVSPRASFTIVHGAEAKKHEDVDLVRLRDQMNGIARACMDKALEKSSGHDRSLTIYVEREKASDLVASYVDSMKPDLVAFGRSNKSGLKAFVLGSTARLLIERLQCDLLVASAGK